MKKKCTKCGEVKSFTNFCKRSYTKDTHKDSFQSWCKKCVREGTIKYINTERGYLKEKYHHIKTASKLYRRYGRISKCLFTFDEFLAAWEKHKSIYGMRSAWGPGPDHLEQHLPTTRIYNGGGGHRRTHSNLSVDRLDSGRDYTLQNIIFIRADENVRKKDTSYEDCKIQIRLHEERFKNEIEERK
tara:strand:+ start:31 stop:588 length:558 start_codon:yes stop_codon:yes gene_type:complete